MNKKVQEMLDAISSEQQDKMSNILIHWDTDLIQTTLQEIVKRIQPGGTDLKAFTMAAMQGLCANPNSIGGIGSTSAEEAMISSTAIRIARAILSKLQSENQ